ncbi:septal ring lytic transglycosylase RlpA family protein [Paraferrimonas sp. SM1919]|uniref:septal ring lytic transglycosylase RlpA family protein n=1 Tax=Paraferrimonas sp. SM1919 TaxID=2662263 RepID=UPI0013D0AB74|nr:septal ring lytic transglycosylase RlpA family protein [Paraferrimonas sp. SM1919]
MPKIFSLVIALLLSSCSIDNGRYQMAQDRGPSYEPDLSQTQLQTPKAEAYSRGGNKDYQVWGKSYKVLTTHKDFSEQGIASWYGKKFHGHLTSNGEIYDMYQLTAAHKHLPIPSYAKVTNLDNGKQVIVRVNDRGPFHNNRVIDLSYAAAAQLDYLKTGTANVRIDSIWVEQSTPQTPLPLPQMNSLNQYFIQVMASKDPIKVQAIASKLQVRYGYQSQIDQQQALFKLRVGPFSSRKDADQLKVLLKQAGYTQSYIVSSQSKS